MSVLRTRNVSRALTRKGFSTDRDSHHIYFHLHVNSCDTGIYTYISQGSAAHDIPTQIQHKMAKQMYLSYAQFLQFVECHIQQDEYLRILREQGLQLDKSDIPTAQAAT
jgi:hypothetical protein